MVLNKSKAKDGIEIVLWDFDYGEVHHYSIMAYPIATDTDWQNCWGPKRGEKFCLEIAFETLKDAKKSFQELENGEKEIKDLKDSFAIKEYLEFF